MSENPLSLGRHLGVEGVYFAASGEVVQLFGDWDQPTNSFGVNEVVGGRNLLHEARRRSLDSIDAEDTNYIGKFKVYSKNREFSLTFNVLEIRIRKTEDGYPYNDVVVVLSPPTDC